MRRSRSAIGVVGALLLAAALGASASAASGDVLSVMLIDETLTARKVTLVGFDGREVIFLDQQGAQRRIGQDRLTALVAIDSGTDLRDGLGAAVRRALVDEEAGSKTSGPSGSQGMVYGVEGRRFPGELEVSASVEETLLWRHQRFGELRLPLEAVSLLLRAGWSGEGQAALADGLPVEDELYLLNGDVLRGFLVSLSDPVEFESGDDVLELEMERIGAIRLSNGPQAISGLVVWLNDGTVTTLDGIVSRQDRNLVLTLPEGQAGVYEVSEVRGLAFDAARLRPLASLEPQSQEAVGGRLFLEAMREVAHPDARQSGAEALNSRDLLLPGPMSVTWALPPGCERLAGTAALVYGAAPWGDCELVIEVDGVERYRTRLSASASTAPFNLELQGRELTIRVEPGLYGPINDRVILHRPTLLLERPGA